MGPYAPPAPKPSSRGPRRPGGPELSPLPDRAFRVSRMPQTSLSFGRAAEIARTSRWEFSGLRARAKDHVGYRRLGRGSKGPFADVRKADAGARKPQFSIGRPRAIRPLTTLVATPGRRRARPGLLEVAVLHGACAHPSGSHREGARDFVPWSSEIPRPSRDLPRS